MSNTIRQYQNSPIISEIIKKAEENISPSRDIENLFVAVLDILTCQGVALDIWGRVVGIDRSIPDPISPVNFGFDGATGSEGFDLAPVSF